LDDDSALLNSDGRDGAFDEFGALTVFLTPDDDGAGSLDNFFTDVNPNPRAHLVSFGTLAAFGSLYILNRRFSLSTVPLIITD